jgi:hypothetical protein
MSALDFGNAPEVFVDGLDGVDRPTPNTVRLTFFTSHVTERRVALAVRMDVVTLVAVLERLLCSSHGQPATPDHNSAIN